MKITVLNRSSLMQETCSKFYLEFLKAYSKSESYDTEGSTLVSFFCSYIRSNRFTEHFSMSEFIKHPSLIELKEMDKKSASVFISYFFNLAPIAISLLEPLRKSLMLYNTHEKTVFYSLLINSGLRTPRYNSTLKTAAPDSNHQRGLAVDIAYPTCTSLITPMNRMIHLLLDSFCDIGLIETYEFITYDTFVHVSF